MSRAVRTVQLEQLVVGRLGRQLLAVGDRLLERLALGGHGDVRMDSSKFDREEIDLDCQ